MRLLMALLMHRAACAACLTQQPPRWGRDTPEGSGSRLRRTKAFS